MTTDTASTSAGLLRGFAPALITAIAGGCASALGAAWIVAFAVALAAGVISVRLLREAPPSPSPPPPESDSVQLEIMQAIADAAPDAVLFFSDTGTIRYANTNARELFFEGRAPTGSNFLGLVAHAPLALREALLGQSDRLFSVSVDAHDETFHVSRRTFEIQGELHTLLVVKHLTREISRREVDVLKRVVRIISHEVNNSLAPVSSLVHSARLIAKNPQHLAKLDTVFDTIEERAAHLSGFLEGYATLARLPEPRPKDVTWGPFLAQIQTLHPRIQVGAAPETPGYFDAIQLEQVLLNVLKNASESGSPTTEVEIHARSDATGACEIKVLDRGGGFSDEALHNALLPMYSTKERGSGMGLALCREIVEAHGGSLGLANRDDGGAAVIIRLPGRHLDKASDLGRSRLTLTRA